MRRSFFFLSPFFSSCGYLKKRAGLVDARSGARCSITQTRRACFLLWILRDLLREAMAWEDGQPWAEV